MQPAAENKVVRNDTVTDEAPAVHPTSYLGFLAICWVGLECDYSIVLKIVPNHAEL